MSKQIAFSRFFTIAVIMVAAIFQPVATGAGLPAVPGSPVPDDSATSIPVSTLIQWDSPATTETLTPVSRPKVLLLYGHTDWQLISKPITPMFSSETPA